jgi:hypothetical protein
MHFIQTFIKFCIVIKNTKDIQFVIDNHPTILLLHIYYINKIVQKYNENVFTNTLNPMFILKAMDINHQSCLPSYKLSNNLSKITSLHFTIHIKKYGN